MDVLLKAGIVPFTAVSDSIQSMLTSVELTGPSSVTDSSSSLLTAILRERVKGNPTHFEHSAERIISWLITKWTPSGCPSSHIVILANTPRSLV
jgi:ataxia telangiectasia mutated family protein